ncbi:MAG: hypothetical protein FJY58_08415, partial [Betaproteobacteria bacterium]|nr:hypothetical protein [Betaproteobacteria bacterium]
MTKLSINYLLAAEEQDPFRCSLTVDELARAEMASFRLRCGLVAKFLEGQGHKIRICSPSSDGGFFDHLIVQKPPLSTATHHRWLQFAHEWKQRGTSIWLDVSDNPWTGGPRIDFVKRISPICSGFIANSDLIAH